MKRILIFRITAFLIYAVFAIKRVFSTYLTHSKEYYSHANKILGDIDKVYEVIAITDLQRIINYFLIFIVAAIFYLFLIKSKSRFKWLIFLVLIVLSTPLTSFIISSIDRWINPWFYIFNGSQIPVKTNLLSLFHHLMLKNAVAIICISLFAGSLYQIERAIVNFEIIRKKITQIGNSLLFIIPLTWILIVTIIVLIRDNPEITTFASAIEQFIKMIVFQTCLSFLIITQDKYRFLKNLIFALGFTFGFLYVEAFSLAPLGDYFIEFLFDSTILKIILIAVFLPILIPSLFWKHARQRMLKSLQVVRYKSELSNLKSQINPHFLFNSLNSLYGLALEESSPKTSTGIQKLSEMMRFMLRENVEDSIEVSKEIEYIENYIELQKLRVEGNDKVRLEYDIDKACEGKITPMLIIPFIENAFKHGVSAHLESWIDIRLKCEKDSIHLNVKNSNHRKTKSTEEESGIGLENVRQRLAMLYPNKHLFQIFDNDESFEINLKIELN